MVQKRALSWLIRPFLHHFLHRMDIRCFLTVFLVKKMSRLNCYKMTGKNNDREGNMKKLWKYPLKYWYLYLIALVSMVISIYLDVLAPRITKSIIDDVIVGGQLQLLMQLLIGLVMIGFGRAIFVYAKEFIFDVTSTRIACTIRRTLFAHIQKLSVDYFDKHNTGELMARVKDDVDRIWNAMGFVGMLIIECVIHVVMVLWCMFHISPVLTIIPLCIMPIIGYWAIAMENKLGKIYENISEETAKLTTVAQENLAGVRTVKSFARERFEIKKFKQHNGKYYDLKDKFYDILDNIALSITELIRL